MSDPEWWRPERLARLEAEFRERPSEAQANDFASYHLVAAGGDVTASALHLHNDVDPGPKITAIRRCVSLGDPHTILDVGCGAGFTTAALASEFPHASVLGVDLAHDAIRFASRTHTRATFAVATIAPDAEPLGVFDLIWCIEFYPFTRNDDVAAQVGFIRHLASQLSPDGLLLIVMTWRGARSLASVYDRVRESIPEATFERLLIPHPRLVARMPLPAARLTSRILTRLTGRECDKTVVVVRR
jgi:16S rRNA G1207 methylase RsmC